jgi:hypothetical protein
LVALLATIAWVLLPGQGSPQIAANLDPRIEKLVASISQPRLQQLLTTLVGFGSRNTYSSAAPSRGIRAASQWIHDEMQRSSRRLQVGFDVHQLAAGSVDKRILEAVELRNVIALLPGRSPRRIYVTAHYDSYSRGAGPDEEAPGANDNGSGTVLVMELARAFAESGMQFDATLAFMTTAGEEQGLVGARVHVTRARESGTSIQAVFNNDIVGGVTAADGSADGASIRVYSSGPVDSPSRALADFVRRAAARYVPWHRVRLLAREDRFGRSGDHLAFSPAGIAAVGFRESRENFDRQHNPKDTLDGVSFPYLLQNARVNAAAVASLALAPPSPVIGGVSTSAIGPDGRIRWNAVEGAVGYRVYWREAWGPDWQHQQDVGNVTEHPVSRVVLDDHVFGVAAVGPDGHESTISAFP